MATILPIYTFPVFIYSPKFKRLSILACSTERALLSSTSTTLTPYIIQPFPLPNPLSTVELPFCVISEPILGLSIVYGYIPHRPTWPSYHYLFLFGSVVKALWLTSLLYPTMPGSKI
jgi:hypothetical protein